MCSSVSRSRPVRTVRCGVVLFRVLGFVFVSVAVVCKLTPSGDTIW